MTGERNEATAAPGSSRFQERGSEWREAGRRHTPEAWEGEDGEVPLRLRGGREEQAWGVGVTLELAACGTRWVVAPSFNGLKGRLRLAPRSPSWG